MWRSSPRDCGATSISTAKREFYHYASVLVRYFTRALLRVWLEIDFFPKYDVRWLREMFHLRPLVVLARTISAKLHLAYFLVFFFFFHVYS